MPLDNCPECGYDFKKNPQTDPYLHAVGCFNLPGKGPKQDLDNITSGRRRSTEHIKRASIILKATMGGSQ